MCCLSRFRLSIGNILSLWFRNKNQPHVIKYVSLSYMHRIYFSKTVEEIYTTSFRRVEILSPVLREDTNSSVNKYLFERTRVTTPWRKTSIQDPFSKNTNLLEETTKFLFNLKLFGRKLRRINLFDF